MNEKSGSIIVQCIIPLACLVIIIMIMFFNFSNKIKVEAEETVQSGMLKTAEEYADKLKAELYNVRVVGETISEVIALCDTHDAQTLQRYLKATTEKARAYMSVYYEEGGLSIDQNGATVDITDKSYFPYIEHSVDTVQYIYLENDEMEQTSAILLVVPVEERDGVLLLYYDNDNIKSFLKINKEYNQTSIAMLISADGKVIQNNDISSNYVNGGNVWSGIDEYYLKSVTKTKVKIQNASAGCVAVGASDEMRTLIYIPIGINDWAFIAGVGQSYVESNVEYTWQKTSKMLYQQLFVIVIFMIVVAVINVVSRMKNVENNKVLQEKADTDQLTGLNNKVATERKIKEYIDANLEELAMMFILDIDNFKKINDTMGHAFGDEVLRALGKQISANFRVTDIIGRTGGDEFIIFLKALKDDTSIRREAQKLINFFVNFQVGEYVKYSATASIGVAVFPSDGTDFESLYKSADQALYKAKKRGKNQLAYYDDRDREN